MATEKAEVHAPPPYPTNQNAMPGVTTPYVTTPYPQTGYPGQPQNHYPSSPAQPYYPPQNPYPPPGTVGYYPQTTPVQAAHVGQVPYGGGQKQQHQQVVVVAQAAVISQPVQNFCGLIVLSCFVCWCCGWLFGLIAFILAMVAQDRALSDPQSARQLGRASLGVSIAGIVVGIIVIIVIVALNVTSSCNYSYGGTCYRYRRGNYYYN